MSKLKTSERDQIISNEHGILVGVSTRILVIRVISTRLRAAEQANEVEGLKDYIDTLVTSYITPKDTIIVAVVSALGNMTTNRIFNLKSSATSYADQLTAKMDGTASDYIPFGMGYIGVYNPDLLDEQSLSEWCELEKEFFLKEHPDLVKNKVVGIDCLSQKKSISKTLAERKNVLTNYNATLGPVPQDEKRVFWNELLRYWSKLSFNSRKNIVKERKEFFELKSQTTTRFTQYSDTFTNEIIKMVKKIFSPGAILNTEESFKRVVLITTVDNIIIPLKDIVKILVIEGENLIEIRETLSENLKSIFVANEKLLHV
ncbi:hypothetical protein HDU92_004082 [Lobulomyces angularis]|nr:hypothetical protein HDU92_004082 [Lobulomyces angularis]